MIHLKSNQTREIHVHIFVRILCIPISFFKIFSLEIRRNLLSSRLLSKNIKIRIYKIIIWPVVLYGCETWFLQLREEHRLWGCLRTGCWGEYLDQREMKWQEVGDNCIMRSFIICTLLQVRIFVFRLDSNRASPEHYRHTDTPTHSSLERVNLKSWSKLIWAGRIEANLIPVQEQLSERAPRSEWYEEVQGSNSQCPVLLLLSLPVSLVPERVKI
jgi:hypothetical protein